jgi:hypothetical protein
MTGIRKGEPWGRRAEEPVQTTVTGDDAVLADVVRGSSPNTRIGWSPTRTSDFARAVGAGAGAGAGAGGGVPHELPCDAFSWSTSTAATRPGPDLGQLCGVNMAVLGTAPDRVHRRSRSGAVRVVVDDRVVHDGAATSVVVANGQFLRGADVVPRGHPGDGRLEVQVYAVPPHERRAMRRRLTTGSHLPHPAIGQVSGRAVEVRVLDPGRPWRLEVDGVARATTTVLVASICPHAFTLVI